MTSQKKLLDIVYEAAACFLPTDELNARAVIKGPAFSEETVGKLTTQWLNKFDWNEVR